MIIDNELRRDSLTIMMDLLRNMYQPIKPTKLLYKTNLNHTQLRTYLDNLVGTGLIQRVSEPFCGFLITEKGREFLELVAKYQRRGKPLGADRTELSAWDLI